MRPLYAVLLVLVAAAGIVRADKPKHNTLTPKEIADGWVLLFDGETTFGWEAKSGVPWRVAEGILAAPTDKPDTLVCRTLFREFELKLDYFVPKGKEANLIVGFNRKEENRKSCPLYSDSIGWVETKVKVSATTDGFLVEHRLYGGGSAFGGLKGESQPVQLALSGKKALFRNIKIRPLNTQPLFNGKDLTGWKKYTGEDKRAKTEFSVTQDGFLHLKNGPGDLQTEKLYDDFVLQAECRTNGKNLNSGVFFRCIPGDYQNGYEAQIHNGFLDSPKEYIVEEYDPKTNELKDKTKVKSAAIDYGTGAIYRRVPARRQAAKDGEWFTMTVVAGGRHIATWVNGIPMVDWTDNRPLKDNPRNGCRLEKGAISLQGHDPTTDIDFRSIRLAELPKPAK